MFDDQLRSEMSEMTNEPPVTIDLETVRSTGLRKRRNRSVGIASAVAVVVCGAGFGLASFLRAPAVVETDVADDGIGPSEVEVPADSDSEESQLPTTTTEPEVAESDESESPTSLTTADASANSGPVDEGNAGSEPTEATPGANDNEATVTPTEPTTTLESNAEVTDDSFSCQANSRGRISWDDRDQALYRVYRSVDDGESYEWLGRTSGDAFYLDQSFRSDYLYRVDYEGLRRVSCETLDDFVCEVDSAGQVAWTDDDQPLYQVYRSIDGGESYPWLAKSENDTFVIDAEYQPDFQYRVNFPGLRSAVDCGQTP